MNDYPEPFGMSSLDRSHDRRLDSVSDEELLLLFDEPSAAAAEVADESLEPPQAMREAPRLAAPGPSAGETEAPAGGQTENEAVLTLGGSPVVVTVQPGPRDSPLKFDEHLPAFQSPPPEHEDHLPGTAPATAQPEPRTDVVLPAAASAARSAGVEKEFDFSRAIEEEMAARLEASRASRRAIAEMEEWVDAREAAPASDDRTSPARRAEPVAVSKPAAPPSGPAVIRPPQPRTTASGSTGPVIGRRPLPPRPVQRPTPAARPFAWRQVFVSAACLAGPGSVALLLAYWMAG